MNSRWLHPVLLLLAFLPGLWMADYVARNAVDIPMWDMWESAPLLKKWHDGTLGWHDLYAAQIQHRIVVPRLLVIALVNLGGGDFRWEQWATFALSAAGAVMVWVLLSRTLGRSYWRYGIMFVASLMIFSPMLYQNFFWGSSLWMAVPLPCLLGALVILGGRGALWLKFALAMLLAEIATHSFSHGIVMWPVVIVYVLMSPALGSLRARLVCAGAGAALAAVTLGFYFHDFTNTASHAYNLKPGDYALKGGVSVLEGGHIAQVFRFFSGMFGALFARTPFSGHLVDDAQSLGKWVVLPFIACAALVLARCRRLLPVALPWLALAAYVVGVVLMVSVGRAHLGEHRCVLPRYFTVTFFLPVATIVLAFLVCRDRCGGREGWKRAGILGLGIIAALQNPIWQHGLHLCRVWNDARRQGKALTLFINQPDLKPWSVETLDMDVKHWGYAQTREQVSTLREIGLFKPTVLESATLRWFKKEKGELGREKATVDPAKTENGQVVISGNARFGSERPVDMLLFTAPGDDGVVALGVPTPKAILRLHPLDYEFTNCADVPVGDPYRWEARIPEAVAQQSGGRFDIWALDVMAMRITRLKSSP